LDNKATKINRHYKFDMTLVVNKFITIPFWFNDACLVVVFWIIIATYKRRMLYAVILQHRYIIIIDAIASALFVSFLVL